MLEEFNHLGQFREFVRLFVESDQVVFVNLRKGILEYASGEPPRIQRRPAQNPALES